MKAPEFQQVILTPQLTLTAGESWWQSTSNTGGALSANPVFHFLGQQSLRGSVYSSQSANTIEIQFSPDGTNWQSTLTLAVDPDNAGSYPINVDLCFPFFRFVVTDSGGGSTVQIQAQVFPVSGGAASSSGGGTTVVTSAPLTDLGSVQGTVTNTAQSITALFGAAPPATATYLMLTVDPGAVSVRYRSDGQAPTATRGNPIAAQQIVMLNLVNVNIEDLQFISTGANSVLNGNYYKSS